MVGKNKQFDIRNAIQDLIELSDYLLDRIRAGEWVNASDLNQERYERLGDLFRHSSAEELSRFFETLQRLLYIDSRVLSATRLAREEYAKQLNSLRKLKERYYMHAHSQRVVPLPFPRGLVANTLAWDRISLIRSR
ncbi:MAG: hypothetical protein ACREVK_00765 [Gammaproteobacteria bacterium]